MAKPDSTIFHFRYGQVSAEQWRELKGGLAAKFKLLLREDAGKMEYGESTYDWAKGSFEWSYLSDATAPEKGGSLEFGIRRRPFDPPQTNIEILISEILGDPHEK